MYRIFKITPSPVVDFAAEELKKYLRMMMPDCGEIAIEYDSGANSGFRLGLMQDFSLDVSEADDVELDDIVHIDADENGGIIAGDNPRSVLFAVYKYLALNGCRWLFPGIDGEFVPIRKISPQKYHKMADCRYRGQCNEGAESQQCMIETIDFSPKVGMNVYMMEFDIPKVYYDGYYQHRGNKSREPEPVDDDTVLQWKRACECEIAKRGLQFHDIGHGWTCEAFGISTIGGWSKDENNHVPEESREFIALTEGKRDLYHGVALNTNFCMSNPRARTKVADTVVAYAEQGSNVDYLHVWLADWQKNHCECDECRKKIPSDWYVMLLNEIDAKLEAKGLGTRIVFCAYSDTAYPPTCEKINNPKRFSMLLGAISRSYTYSVEVDPDVERTKYVLNVTGRMKTMEEYIAQANEWRRFAPCPSFAYEYHFWKHQYYEPTGIGFAKRIQEDIISYKKNGFDGLIEDGSQRSFFPNGFAYYVFANILFDNGADFEKLKNDYYSHAYGENYERVLEYMEKIGELMPQSYLEVRHSVATDTGKFYSPAQAERFRELGGVLDDFDKLLSENKNQPYRVQTVAVRLLMRFSEYCRGLSRALTLKAMGAGKEALEEYEGFMRKYAEHEIEMERYYDHMLADNSWKALFKSKNEFEQ